jgi:predicted nucleic acid-binding protein
MTLYLDTSSMVKLFVQEDGTAEVRRLVDAADVVATSIVAYAEMRATLARLRRERRLTPAAYLLLKRQFEADWPAFLCIDVTDPIARAAGRLAERHGLRGFDSIHLASFAHILERASDDVHFSCFDDRLNRAAKSLH